MIKHDRKEERTGFQEISPYNPAIDLQTDFVMVYGIDANMPSRVEVWRDRGYVVHLMTGISWGEYQDYLNGSLAEREHWDEAQKNSNNDIIEHGRHGATKIIPYMVPTISYSDYLTDQIKVAVDAGVEAIHLEEPEFWVEAGYSDAFKREWEIYFKEDWKPAHESVDGQYKTSKLKAFLYTRCLDRVSSTLKEYAKVKYNRDLRIYVPTHSLINYTQWRIISPESRLLDLPCIDGYIAQIWTGTSRTPNVYEGVRKERTFETAFLEYGIMQELVRGTGRRMWFLHDPIEDNPNYTWKDYKDNYFKIVTASLLHPEVSHFEICPWPNRVFKGRHINKNGCELEKIPDAYATILLTLMHTLGDMDQEENVWEGENVQMGMLLADSAMFQRNYPEWHKQGESFRYDGTSMSAAEELVIAEMLDWSCFYGMVLPILKDGVPIRPVQLDNVRRFPSYLDDYRVLLLSYEFMKPEQPDLHNAISAWVREGGILVYVGDGSDEFHKVEEWWNKGKKNYASPTEHLFESLGLKAEIQPGIHSVGKGVLGYMKVHPAKCAYEKEYAEKLRETVKSAMITSKDEKLKYNPSNSFILHRGPYIVASVMDECFIEKIVEFNGKFVDLFKEDLPVVNKYIINPGEQCLLYDLNKIKLKLSLIAASSRIDSIESEIEGFSFKAIGPAGVSAVARFYSERLPIKVLAVNSKSGAEVPVKIAIDEFSSTVLIRYSNSPDGILFKAKW